MNKVIRQGVFETNSSSSHSISVAGWPPHNAGRLPVEGGVVTIFEGEFGWEEERYHDAATKASYLATAAHGNEEALARIARVIKANTPGCERVDFSGEGYIDHQSSETPEDAMESDDSIRNFIFNPASVLETDNDNH